MPYNNYPLRANTFFILLLKAKNKDAEGNIKILRELIAVLYPQWTNDDLTVKDNNDLHFVESSWKTIYHSWMRGKLATSPLYIPFGTENFRLEIEDAYKNKRDIMLVKMNNFCFHCLNMADDNLKRLIGDIFYCIKNDDTYKDCSFFTGYKSLTRDDLINADNIKIQFQEFILDIWYKIAHDYYYSEKTVGAYYNWSEQRGRGWNRVITVNFGNEYDNRIEINSSCKGMKYDTQKDIVDKNCDGSTDAQEDVTDIYSGTEDNILLEFFPLIQNSYEIVVEYRNLLNSNENSEEKEMTVLNRLHRSIQDLYDFCEQSYNNIYSSIGLTIVTRYNDFLSSFKQMIEVRNRGEDFSQEADETSDYFSDLIFNLLEIKKEYGKVMAK